MSVFGGPDNFGLFYNGDFRNGNNDNFTFGTFNNTEQLSGEGCIVITGGGGGSSQSSQFIEVDTSKTYQMILYAKTIQRGSQNNSLAGGHIGFATYDSSFRHIQLRMCGGLGNTTLSRDLNVGDSHMYITDDINIVTNIGHNGWVVGDDVTSYFNYGRYCLIFPQTHPEFNKPHEYTRIGTGDYNICYRSMIQTVQGDWELKLCNTSDVDMNMPNIGYSTPVGTPISRGCSGANYCYALSNPNYPEVWTRYTSAPFTGESRSASVPFRFATKYIKFLVLRNYNQRNETPQDHIWALDNIFFGRVEDSKDYRNNL